MPIMTLPTTTTTTFPITNSNNNNNNCSNNSNFTTTTILDDDSDIFGPPRSSPPLGLHPHHHHHQKPRVSMISPKLRLREERKRILQLCAHKLERIKDSETNLRRSVCINNTYSRLTDELRKEKQNRYITNSSKSDIKSTTSSSSHDSIFGIYNSQNDRFHHHNKHHSQQQSSNLLNSSIIKSTKEQNQLESSSTILDSIISETSSYDKSLDTSSQLSITASLSSTTSSLSCSTTSLTTTTTTITPINRCFSSDSVDADLEILDRELNAINASMPLIDPEITQGAEQLEKAISSRKRLRSEDENDRLVREALSQFYLPTQRLISGIDDYPFDMKRTKFSSTTTTTTNNNNNLILHHQNNNNYNTTITNYNNNSSSNLSTELDLDLNLDFNNHQTQKDFEVIMDALRLGTNSPTTIQTQTTSSPTTIVNDSCGQAAMLSESGVFHSLVVTSLET